MVLLALSVCIVGVAGISDIGNGVVGISDSDIASNIGNGDGDDGVTGIYLT